jgi:Mrp family chromosome partitioning ATPase
MLAQRILKTKHRNVFSFSTTSANNNSTLKNGRVVVVSSGKGGVGKTTTAASFAYGLAEKGFKTCKTTNIFFCLLNST